ncbi:hypothetical protein JKP88DRAFT_256894 [Tribonema minus]|uniref:EF-hand domain-containing protein n=1 Tax=Tribonema minus TaxID=303371 RepID=A0A835ZDH5_9STRA|nr:hypothetical protein JKP88DRAFT_256894 [Tribonema minus]
MHRAVCRIHRRRRRGRENELRATPVDTSEVPKNSKGGVLVTDEELRAVFEFFDVDGRGVITSTCIRKRMGAFYKNMNPREYKFLMNNKSEMTLNDLRELLVDNEVTDFDPVAEAFKAYDPDGTGYVDVEVLRTIFSNLGFGDINNDDLAILVEAADVDGDGQISLNDFRRMTDFNKDYGKPHALPVAVVGEEPQTSS